MSFFGTIFPVRFDLGRGLVDAAELSNNMQLTRKPSGIFTIDVGDISGPDAVAVLGKNSASIVESKILGLNLVNSLVGLSGRSAILRFSKVSLWRILPRVSCPKLHPLTN